MGEVFQKQAFEHSSLNASKNSSHRDMLLVSSLKKMGSGGQTWLHITKTKCPFIPL